MKWYRRAVIYLLLIGFTGVLWWAALFQNRNSTGRSLIVTFLDVGQGDCAVIQAPSGRTLLIDAGPRLQRDDAGRRVVWPFLRSQGIHRIDALILTHPDDDHFGGAITLVNRLQITELFTNGMPSDSSLYQYVLRRARRQGSRLLSLRRDDMLQCGKLVIYVLNPPRNGFSGNGNSDNDNSLVLRLDYGKTRFLFTADAGHLAENDILASGLDLQCDILKVAHHGSNGSTGERWLQAVAPKVAVISVGRHNRFGHPHAGTLYRLRSIGARILRTDRDGAIRCVTDGQRIRITPFHPALDTRRIQVP